MCVSERNKNITRDVVSDKIYQLPPTKKNIGTTGSWFHYLMFYINWHGSFIHCCWLTLTCYLI